MQYLMKHWNIAGMKGLNAEGQEAQEQVCKLLTRFQKLTDRQMNQAKNKRRVEQPFSWIFNKPVSVFAWGKVSLL